METYVIAALAICFSANGIARLRMLRDFCVCVVSTYCLNCGTSSLPSSCGHTASNIQPGVAARLGDNLSGDGQRLRRLASADQTGNHLLPPPLLTVRAAHYGT